MLVCPGNYIKQFESYSLDLIKTFQSLHENIKVPQVYLPGKDWMQKSSFVVVFESNCSERQQWKFQFNEVTAKIKPSKIIDMSS